MLTILPGFDRLVVSPGTELSKQLPKPMDELRAHYASGHAANLLRHSTDTRRMPRDLAIRSATQRSGSRLIASARTASVSTTAGWAHCRPIRAYVPPLCGSTLTKASRSAYQIRQNRVALRCRIHWNVDTYHWRASGYRSSRGDSRNRPWQGSKTLGLGPCWNMEPRRIALAARSHPKCAP